MVDGTLFPCPDWRGRRDLWSVKHGSAGMNVQILVQLDGGFVWASDPYPGSMHDVAGTYLQMQYNTPRPWKVILGVSQVISGRRYGDGPLPWGIMGVKDISP